MASDQKRKTSAAEKKKAQAQAQARLLWEDRRRRFIAALIISVLAVVFLLIYFFPGENLWYGMHRLFRGTFGFFGAVVPAVMLYFAYHNAKSIPPRSFRKKTLLLSLILVDLSTVFYSFGSTGLDIEGYFPALGSSYINAVSSPGSGLMGAILGVPSVKLFGSAGSGIIFIALLIVLLALTLDGLFLRIAEAFKAPVERVGEHIDDEKTIRNEVRRMEQQHRAKKRQQQREEYVQQEIDKRFNKRVKSDPEFAKIKKTPFYEPDGLADEPDDIVAKEKPKRKAKERTEKETIPESIAEAAVDAVINSGEEFDLSELEISPDDVPEQPIQQPEELPKEKKKKKTKSEQAPEEAFTIDPESSAIIGHYLKPPFSLLEPQPKEEEHNISAELNHRGTMLIETLKSFGVQASIVNICRGPSVTRYELQPAAGVKISKITNLSDDIAMNLAAIGVRIEAPIPGKSAVGIEIPNKHVSMVKMRGLVESKEFQESKSNLTVALGKDITGKITLADLSRMPHLLIAGSTGSGKSVCINSMLVSLLYKASPDDVKLMLIDPKVVELGVYNGIPHLLVPVVTDPRKAAGALNWAVNEMLNRYKTFAEYNVRDMHSYNRFVERQNAEVEASEESDSPLLDDDRSFEEDEMLAKAQAELEDDQPDELIMPVKLKKMAQIVIVIDELADLMMAAPKDVEDAICRLAQMARAAGMHLVIATQRPSVDVITGLIKANVPSRIAFAVKSQIDSRTILDTAGAEKLLGRGDMLYSPIGVNKPIRVQGCFVDDTEIENIISFIKQSQVVEYDKDVIDQIERSALGDTGAKPDENDGELDPMMEEAIQCVVEAGQASTSMLQRRLRLGYARAGRIIDEMEQIGVVGPHEGSKPRQVLMTYQQWLERKNTKPD